MKHKYIRINEILGEPASLSPSSLPSAIGTVMIMSSRYGRVDCGVAGGEAAASLTGGEADMARVYTCIYLCLWLRI